MTRHIPRIVVMLLALLSIETFACECSEPEIEQAYANADLVLLGTVAEVMSNSTTSGSIAIFKSTRQWKQKAASQMVITTPSDCMYTWQRGENHLLFLTKGNNALYTTRLCMGNKNEADAAASVEWLNENAD